MKCTRQALQKEDLSSPPGGLKPCTGVKTPGRAWLKSLLGLNFNLHLLLVALRMIAAGVLTSWLRPARSTPRAA
jgi:hypothetical protein